MLKSANPSFVSQTSPIREFRLIFHQQTQCLLYIHSNPTLGERFFIFMYFQKWKLSLSTQSCIILFTKIFLLLLPLFIFYSLLTFTSFLSCFLHLSPSLHNPVFFYLFILLIFVSSYPPSSNSVFFLLPILSTRKPTVVSSLIM